MAASATSLRRGHQEVFWKIAILGILKCQNIDLNLGKIGKNSSFLLKLKASYLQLHRKINYFSCVSCYCVWNNHSWQLPHPVLRRGHPGVKVRLIGSWFRMWIWISRINSLLAWIFHDNVKKSKKISIDLCLLSYNHVKCVSCEYANNNYLWTL